MNSTNATGAGTTGAPTVSLDEARAIAKEATIYGFPIVDSYRIQHSYFVDRGGPEYKALWNAIFNNERVYTPDDKAIQSPNSDTPYSYVGADLRAEPLVFSVPAVAKERYYSLQLIDMYTYNFAYIGSRATGVRAGNYLLAGPGWKGANPPGIDSVIRCETEFAFVLYRTQLFDPGDIEKVKKVQAGYGVQPLSRFLGTAAAPPAPVVDFPKPLPVAEERTSLEFFGLLNTLLSFCPPHPAETEMMARFARIGVGAGRAFDVADLSPEMRTAFTAGMADAFAAFAEYKTTQIDTGKRTSADGFGTREHLKGDYLQRMTSALLGIYGNSKEEAIYPAQFVDDGGQKPDGSHRYTMRFPPGRLPPVNAFWSLTLYALPESLLYANPLKRYLINSAMLPTLAKDADGGITLSVQNESPGKEGESNWLPAPKGPFFTVLRLYWPKPEALNGAWTAPSLHQTASSQRGTP